MPGTGEDRRRTEGGCHGFHLIDCVAVDKYSANVTYLPAASREGTFMSINSLCIVFVCLFVFCFLKTGSFYVGLGILELSV